MIKNMDDLQKIMDLNTNRSNLNRYKYAEDKELFVILEKARNKWLEKKLSTHIKEVLNNKG